MIVANGFSKFKGNHGAAFMWKDFIHFTQREKRGLLVLITLIFLVLLVNVTMPYWLKSAPVDFTEFKAEVDAYYDSLEQVKSQISPTQKPSLPLSSFMVDKVSSQWLIDHGLKPYIAKNLISYRDKKGALNSVDEVAKVYGMTDSIMNIWSPFMVFPKPVAQLEKAKKVPPKPKAKQVIKQEPDFLIDINTADTAMFTLLNGIGPTFSKRIVKYRNLLGGFYSIQQIREVYGMDSARFSKINTYLHLDSISLRKLEINLASLKTLKNHPYLNFYQAKAIYEYRKEAWIENWNLLLSIENLDTTNLNAVKPYIAFTKP